MKNLVERVGGKALNKIGEIGDFFHFAYKCVKGIVSGSFLNRASFDILVLQIYFTAYQLLGLFLLLSIFCGTIFIGIVLQTVKNLGLVQYLGEIVMGLVVLELAPLITVFLLALRSSSAINSEIAVMKVNREIDALEAFKIDPTTYLFVPRIISFIVSVAVLSLIFSIVVLVSGFIFCHFLFSMNLGAYTDLIAKSVAFSDLILLFFKSVLFGFFISVIPIYNGWKTKYQITAIPVSVLKGMMQVFMSIILVEAFSLLLRSALNYL